MPPARRDAPGDAPLGAIAEPLERSRRRQLSLYVLVEDVDAVADLEERRLAARAVALPCARSRADAPGRRSLLAAAATELLGGAITPARLRLQPHRAVAGRRHRPRQRLRTFQLARMGTSVKIIDCTCGRLAHDSEEHLRGLLAARAGQERRVDGERR